MRAVIRRRHAEGSNPALTNISNWPVERHVRPSTPLASLDDEMGRQLDALELCMMKPTRIVDDSTSDFYRCLSVSKSTQQSGISGSQRSTMDTKTPENQTVLKQVNPHLMLNDKRRFKRALTISSVDVRQYCQFLDNDAKIRKFLRMDYCRMKADKYLLAMVFIYFKRANVPIYTRSNFFKLLYLAHDTEEEDEEYKYEIFPWAIGGDWVASISTFLREKNELWKRMDFRTLVSISTLIKVMDADPFSSVWKRDRPLYHGGATRPWNRPVVETLSPRGPEFTPITCQLCTKHLSETEIPTRLKRRMSSLKQHCGPPCKVARNHDGSIEDGGENDPGADMSPEVIQLS